MGLTKKEAYEILGLSQGALLPEITVHYKRLALEWYPQKHNYSAHSHEKFKKISHAYKMLTAGSTEKMSMDDMLRLFQEVFFNKQVVHSSDDSSYEDIDDDDYNSDILDQLYNARDILNSKSSTLTTTEKIDRAFKNGQELIAEEEKEKKKAERRRAKKRRQKLKKKQEKEMSQKQNKNDEGNGVEDTEEQKQEESTSSDSEEEGIDPNSAFVAIAANKKRVNKQVGGKNTNGSNSEECVYSETIILQSRQIAARAIEMANVEQYQAAIDLFTAAIKLYPKDFRYFGNRSYCFDRITQYERALKDSEKAILLSPQWAKGYFRKGRALCGLKRYAEAETCFETVLKLDKECKEVFQELKVIRMLQLHEMGFSEQQAELALREHKTLQAALEFLVNGNGNKPGKAQQRCDTAEEEDIYQSDEDDFILATRFDRMMIKPTDDKMNPRNPEGRTSLWVGNIRPEVTEKLLSALFGKFGVVVSVRIISDKACAFVNYKQKDSASRAMSVLQGKEVYGAELLIRFPDHPHTFGPASVTVLRKKGAAPAKPEEKQKGSVNGNECYFYRTTGCVYGDHCRYLHIKEHRGIDKGNIKPK